MKRTRRHEWVIPALFACFFAGGMAGWWLHKAGAPAPVVSRKVERESAVATIGKADQVRSGGSAEDTAVRQSNPDTSTSDRDHPRLTADTTGAGAIAELRRHDPRLPIDGADLEKVKGGFDERRGGGERGHEAVDILAPRNTPIHAAEDGTIAKLFSSKAGGTTIYQFDPSGRFCYYYAHLERYASGLHEGQRVSKGDVIGYVGSSGNAPANTPHLHLAVFALTPERHWWEGEALDPYDIFKK